MARVTREAGSFSLGVSFSARYCEDLSLDPSETLQALLSGAGVRRLRLVSHWDRMERVRGLYDFRELDRQLAMALAAGAHVTLCLGIRQPRYPEFHQPAWAKKLGPGAERNKALQAFTSAVVGRYKENKVVESWQLENEALNRSFGEGDDFDRRRLCSEFNQLKQLDPIRPVIMTASNAWGIPLRAPIPDVIGLSLYRIQHKSHGYKSSPFPVSMYRLRAVLIRLIWNRPTIIHELQAEPWGPTGTQELTLDEQNYSMNAQQLEANINFAIATGINYADLWGGEYWYWRWKKFGDDSMWKAARQLFEDYPA